MIPVGGTLLPIILMSDATQLTNFSGDQKSWPVYMTIGNLNSKIRQKHHLHTICTIAMLPTGPKLKDFMDKKTRDRQAAHNNSVFHECVRAILAPLTDVVQRNTGVTALCADGAYRRVFPCVAAWIADYPEHILLQNLGSGACPVCEADKSRFEDNGLAACGIGRDHRDYRDCYISGSYDRLDNALVKRSYTALWDLLLDTDDMREDFTVISEIWKPDILHVIIIGMLKHLLEWVHHLLKYHKRLQLFNEVWLSVPTYLTMTRPNKAYEDITQWTGKKYKSMAHFLLVVLTVTLRFGSRNSDYNTPTGAEKKKFDTAIQCTRNLIDFYLYSTYERHDDDTIRLMKHALDSFHQFKDAFLRHRELVAARNASSLARAEANEGKQNFLGDSTGAERRRREAEWKRYVEQEANDAWEKAAHFNLPKMHLMQHFVPSIQEFGNIIQWSTEHSEAAHKHQIKRGYASSNRCGDISQQIANWYQRREAFVCRQLNNEWVESGTRGDNAEEERQTEREITQGETDGDSNDMADDDIIDTPPAPTMGSIQYRSGADKIVTLTQVLGLAEIDDFFPAFQRHITDLQRFAGISSEEALSAAAAVYHNITVPVQHFANGKWERQKLISTVKRNWHGKHPRNDWAWWKPKRQGGARIRPYGALHGRLPVKLCCLFSVNLDGETLNLALVETTTPVNNGRTDDAAGLVRVERASIRPWRVIDVGSIDGAAHLIPEPKISGETWPKTWWVNSQIDLKTWNFIYEYEEEPRCLSDDEERQSSNERRSGTGNRHMRRK